MRLATGLLPAADALTTASSAEAAAVEEAIRKTMAECPSRTSGWPKDEAEQIVQAAIDAIPGLQAGLTFAQVAEAIRKAMADTPG